MTPEPKKAYDVFLSHAATDGAVAREIIAALEVAGLQTFHPGAVESGADVSDAIWYALAESRALVVILSPGVPTNALGLVELGAATAWNKPIFVLLNDPASTKLPPALAAYPVYPINRLEEVIQAIRSGFESLTEEDLKALATVYQRLRVPAEELTDSPSALQRLTGYFNRTAHKQLSGERLLSELFRMRKTGQLPQLRRRSARRVKAAPFLKTKKG
jgi:hypothetical protein